MDAERWRRIEEVFQRALDATGDGRAAILEQSCGGDQALRREVESLLAHYARGAGFIETPAVVALSRKVGTMVGHYRVLEEIGGGGMGIVYKAEDTKLGRVVALKFLARYHSAAADAIARVRSEARVASSLNHPNVCVIYDIEEEAGEQFIAMEFIEGRTLAELLSSGPLDASTIATLGSQIGDGLAAAHRKGIIHRDIKPANIIVSTAGLVKVLDFGLAKLLDHERSMTAALADTGAIAGTLPYMSPEQLRDADVDHRADIFALGAVLYEMAAGRRPFTGTSVPDVIDRILNHEAASPKELNARISPDLSAIIAKCLEKDPARRYQRADELAMELRGLVPSAGPAHRAAAARRTALWASLPVGVAVIVAIAAAWSFRQPSAPPLPPLRWEQLTNFPDSATSPAFSPDGRRLAFIRGPSTFVGPGDIYIKRLPDGEPVQLTNDRRGKQDPLFSPDGSRVVYTTGPLPYDVWTVPVTGGTPQLMMANAGTLAWTGDGRVMFAEVRGIPHMAIVTTTEDRREPRDVYVPPTKNGMAHRAYLSPDKKWVLIAEMDTGGQGWLPCRLVPFDGSSPGRQVGPEAASCTSAAWSPDGKWMYLSSAAGGNYHIWRQRVPDGVPEQVTFGPTQEEGIAMAADGRSFVTSVGGAQSTLSIRDASGERMIATEATVTSPQFSADGRTLLYLVEKQLRALDRQGGELWKVDVASGRRERLMPGFRIVTYAVSDDGRFVAASVLDGDGQPHIWVAPVDGHAPPTRVAWRTPVMFAVFHPADGLFILAREGASRSVYLTDLNGGNGRKLIADTATNVVGVSPSGKWLLVQAQVPGGQASNAGVVAYPVDGGSPVTVFNMMWSMARWTPDGRSLYMRFDRDDATEIQIAVVPVSADHELPPLPPGGLKSAADVARIPGAKMIGLGVAATRDVAAVAVSPDLSTVAIVRTAVHRNLYRVPLP